MVHSVEITQKRLIINYEKIFNYFIFFFFISNLLFAKSQYFQEGLDLYKKI